MNPYAAYQSSSLANFARVDMLLALFDRSIDRLEQARETLLSGNRLKAQNLLLRAQGLVMGLASGVDPNAPIASKLLPLYKYIVHAIGLVDVEKTADSIRLLSTVREGFRAIRAEAIDLERNGVIPPVSNSALVHSMA
jgi:flagellar secretion chaperone FliS